jgi:uncharacterized membrane protein SpoIIM required for sporulation
MEKKASDDLFSRSRLIFILVVFAIEVSIFFAGTVVPLDQATQQALNQSANNLRNETLGAPPLVTMRAIFSNNLRVALLDMIPGAGALVFAATMFTTGQILQVLTTTAGVPGILLGLLLFIFPYSIVELSAYAIAVVSGTMLIVAWRRKTLRREIRVFLYEGIGVVLILFLAAAMETITLVSYVLGLALWIPIVLVLAWVAFRARKNRL